MLVYEYLPEKIPANSGIPSVTDIITIKLTNRLNYRIQLWRVIQIKSTLDRRL